MPKEEKKREEKSEEKKENKKDREYVELKVKNPWAISTWVLALVIIAGVILFFTVGRTGTASSGSGASLPANQVGQSIVTFLGSQVNGTVAMKNVTEISGIYQINVVYQGQTIPVYATEDGKYLMSQIIPLP